MIPTLNEVGCIGSVLTGLTQLADEQAIALEVLVVDSCSDDGTTELVQKMATKDSRIQCLMEPERGNLAAAWRRGIASAKGDAIGFMDADGVHDPADIPRLLAGLQDGADLVIGSRYMGDPAISERVMTSKSRKNELSSRIGQVAARWMLGLRVKDISHGFRVFNRRIAEQVLPALEAKGNTWLVEMVFESQRLGYQIREIPVIYGDRIAGVDKQNVPREFFRFAMALFSLRRRKGRLRGQ